MFQKAELRNSEIKPDLCVDKVLVSEHMIIFTSHAWTKYYHVLKPKPSTTLSSINSEKCVHKDIQRHHQRTTDNMIHYGFSSVELDILMSPNVDYKHILLTKKTIPLHPRRNVSRYGRYIQQIISYGSKPKKVGISAISILPIFNIVCESNK